MTQAGMKIDSAVLRKVLEVFPTCSNEEGKLAGIATRGTEPEVGRFLQRLSEEERKRCWAAPII